MGGGAADIAEVVSDVKDRLPGLKPPSQMDSPDQARFRLFDSITAFLKTASQKQPLVLVLDDLHWADQPSLLLLQFVARELPGGRLLLVGTYRDVELSRQHPLAEALGELTRERLFQRVVLRGLTQDDVGRFIEMTSGMSAPPGLIEAVHSQTEGNPLFVNEVVRLLVEEGVVGAGFKPAPTGNGPDSWTIRIPEGVREVIGRRLNRLSQRCNETLTVASVIGREFRVDQLKPAMEEPSPAEDGAGLGMTEDRLLEVLEEALAARVIEELPQAVGRYQFTHALIQETLTAELSLTRRVRLHARVAVALEDLYGDDTEAHAAELAHHFAQAQTVLGPEKLVHYSLMAGERAIGSYAWEEAQSHFERGLTARGLPLGSSDPAPDAAAAALLFGLGRARAATGYRRQLQEALDTAGRAFDFYVESGDIPRALAIAEYSFPASTGGRTELAGFVVRALDLAPEHSTTRGRLLCRYGLEVGRIAGDFDAAEEAFSQALTIAQAENDPALEARVFAFWGNVCFFHLRVEEARDKLLWAIKLARGVDDIDTELTARINATRSLANLGDLPSARSQASLALELADGTRDRYRLQVSLRLNAVLARTSGEFEAALDFIQREIALSPEDSQALETGAVLAYDLGDFSQGADYVERLLETVRKTPSTRRGGRDDLSLVNVLPAIARVTGDPSHLEKAEEAAAAALSAPYSNPAIVRA